MPGRYLYFFACDHKPPSFGGLGEGRKVAFPEKERKKDAGE
jgi:hypothetical protein